MVPSLDLAQRNQVVWIKLQFGKEVERFDVMNLQAPSSITTGHAGRLLQQVFSGECRPFGTSAPPVKPGDGPARIAGTRRYPSSLRQPPEYPPSPGRLPGPILLRCALRSGRARSPGRASTAGRACSPRPVPERSNDETPEKANDNDSYQDIQQGRTRQGNLHSHPPCETQQPVNMCAAFGVSFRATTTQDWTG